MFESEHGSFLQSKQLSSIHGHIMELCPSKVASPITTPEHKSLSTRSGRSLKQSRQACSSPVRWTSFASYPILVGKIRIGIGIMQYRRDKFDITSDEQERFESPVWTLEFQPASWFKRRGYLLFASTSYGDWQYNLRPFNMRDADSPIFLACRLGDFDQVRRLLDEGQASPFDVGPKGITLLHVNLDSSR